MNDTTAVGVRDDARWKVRAQVRQLAADAFGATLTETPIDGYEILTRPGMDDPLAGIRAAMLVRDIGAGLISDYVDEARGAGKTWAEIATALGIVRDGEDDYRSLAEIAYCHIVEHEPLPVDPDAGRWRRFDRIYTSWTCGSCGERVRDSGPFESHPDDNETGHAENCARHGADIAAWRTQTGWEDDE